MFTNKTQANIRKKFDLNPYKLQLKRMLPPPPSPPETYQPASGTAGTAETSAAETSAAIRVPNYLQKPKFTSSKPVFICLFQIRMDGLYPFLLFLTYRQAANNMICLLSFPTFDGGKNNKHLKREAVEYVTSILNPVTPGEEISYAGFIELVDRHMLILKYVGTPAASALPVNYEWALAHELVNTRTIKSYLIEPYVLNFFRQHLDLLTLRDENEIPYESPVVGYYKSPQSSLADIYRETLSSEIGQKHYFFWVDMPQDKGKDKDADGHIIIRAALFLKRLGLHTPKIDDYDSLLIRAADNQLRYVIKAYTQHTLVV
jgi:hypothetical protein